MPKQDTVRRISAQVMQQLDSFSQIYFDVPQDPVKKNYIAEAIAPLVKDELDEYILHHPNQNPQTLTQVKSDLLTAWTQAVLAAMDLLAEKATLPEKSQRETFAPPSQTQIDEMGVIINDPLSLDQKLKIIDYAFQFRYATLKNDPPPIMIAGQTIRPADLLDVFTQKGNYRNLNSKELNDIAIEADKLAFSPVQMGEESTTFESFRTTLQNPANKAVELGIDENNPAQIYAARILMESVFKAQLRVQNDLLPKSYGNYSSSPYRDCLGAYRDTLCNEDFRHIQTNQKISGKHALLMKMDPIQPLKKSHPVSSLDILLSNTHFETGVWMRTMLKDRWHEDVQDREQYRQLIKNEITRLYNEPHTHHVLAALGEIMRAEPHHLLISKVPMSTGNLGAIHHAGSGTAGFFDNSDTIVSRGFVNPADQKIDYGNLGSVTHEALHLIFQKILSNRTSPISTPAEAQELDALIDADQKLRQNMNRATFTSDEKKIWTAVVENLENEKSYFPSGQSEEGRRHIMRAEIIVKPMELIASGCSEAAIKKMMPNVYDFYQKKSRPLIESWIKQKADQYTPPVTEESSAPQDPRLLDIVENIKNKMAQYVSLYPESDEATIQRVYINMIKEDIAPLIRTDLAQYRLQYPNPEPHIKESFEKKWTNEVKIAFGDLSQMTSKGFNIAVKR